MLACLDPLIFFLPMTLNYLAFQSFDYQRTRRRLFQLSNHLIISVPEEGYSSNVIFSVVFPPIYFKAFPVFNDSFTKYYIKLKFKTRIVIVFRNINGKNAIRKYALER